MEFKSLQSECGDLETERLVPTLVLHHSSGPKLSASSNQFEFKKQFDGCGSESRAVQLKPKTPSRYPVRSSVCECGLWY